MPRSIALHRLHLLERRSDYKIGSASGTIFTVRIPHDARTALMDPTYSWRMAIQAEIDGEFTADFAWKYMYEIPPCRTVLQGMRIFSTECDDYTPRSCTSRRTELPAATPLYSYTP